MSTQTRDTKTYQATVDGNQITVATKGAWVLRWDASGPTDNVRFEQRGDAWIVQTPAGRAEMTEVTDLSIGPAV